MSYDFIIIGAGISGHAAARYLRDAGLSSLMLEAESHDGGRTLTDHTLLDFGLELGAELLHVLDSEVGQIISNLGLRTVDWPKEDETLWRLYRQHAELLTTPQARSQNPDFNMVRAWDLPRPDPLLKETLEEYVKRCWKYSAQQIRWLDLGMGNACGANSHDLDARQTLREVFAYATVDKLGFGYDNVIKYLAKGQVKGQDLLLNSPVANIDWSNPNKVKVTLEDGKTTYEAKAVIVTIPLGVLQNSKGLFTPGIGGDWQAALDMTEMAPFVKATLAFPRRQPVFEDDKIISLRLDSITPTLWKSSAAQTDTEFDVWTAFAGGPNARALSLKGGAGALAHTLEALRQGSGNRHLQPVRGLFTDWSKKHRTRGGYSRARPGGADARTLISRPMHPIYFAGEHTSGADPVHGGNPEQDGSETHSAYRSGVRAAKQAMARLSRG